MNCIMKQIFYNTEGGNGEANPTVVSSEELASDLFNAIHNQRRRDVPVVVMVDGQTYSVTGFTVTSERVCLRTAL